MAEQRKKKCSRAQIFKAIDGSGGIVLNVAKKLDVSWPTAKGYLKNDVELKEAFKIEGERLLDEAEIQLRKRVKKGDIAAIKYLLSTKGRRRGYGERLDLNHSNGGIVVVPEQDSLEEYRRLAEEYQKSQNK